VNRMPRNKYIKVKKGPLGLGAVFGLIDKNFIMRCPYCRKLILDKDATFDFMYEQLTETVLNPNCLWIGNQTARLLFFHCIYCKQKVYLLIIVTKHGLMMNGELFVNFEGEYMLLTSDEVKTALRRSNIELDDLEIDEVDIKQFINS